MSGVVYRIEPARVVKCFVSAGRDRLACPPVRETVRCKRRCEDCHAEKLVAFSCKRRGFCPSCGARRMTDSAALLADEVLPAQPIRQWVLSLPLALRFLLATDPDALTKVLGIVYRAISAHVLKEARLTRASGGTGAVTLIQRFGSALNLNIHFHMLALDGAYLVGTDPPVFRRIAPPTQAALQALLERLVRAHRPLGGAGAAAAGTPDAVSRRVRCTRGAARGDHPGRKRHRGRRASDPAGVPRLFV
jgi:hypothetical protein